jgi:trimethylamine--corrinoid protein Co-methyltransferase
MDILAHAGINFNDAATVNLFRKNGFSTDGRKVFITESDVYNALETAPPRFTILARNPDNSVSIGGDDFVFIPTAGMPNVVEVGGEQRPVTFKDYITCCKLVQTSDQMDLTAFLMVQPTDLPPDTAHLDMVYANIVMCDKPFGSATTSGAAARDSLQMAGLIWGGRDKLIQHPVTVAIANPTSPLQYSMEQATLIIEMARYRQPVAITNMLLAGSTAPVSLPGLLALQNAEILGGLVLSQLAGPGTPVIYGATSAPLDMKRATSALGAPETLVIASAAIQLAKFYHLPCRTGGMLTDSHCQDAQALGEGAVLMSTAVRNGANFILHACGQMGSFISMSFEKWLIDEEVCATIRRMLVPLEISAQTIDVETIKSIAAYSKPPIDEGLEQALTEYVHRRKLEAKYPLTNQPLEKVA